MVLRQFGFNILNIFTFSEQKVIFTLASLKRLVLEKNADRETGVSGEIKWRESSNCQKIANWNEKESSNNLISNSYFYSVSVNLRQKSNYFEKIWTAPPQASKKSKYSKTV